MFNKLRRGRTSSRAPPSTSDAGPSTSGAGPSTSGAAPPTTDPALDTSGAAPSPPALVLSGAAHSPGAADSPGPSTGDIAGSSTGQVVPQTRVVFISPLGDSFSGDSIRIVHDINRIVNNHWRGDYFSFRSTPTSTKELWWSEFKRAYTWDPTHEREIRKNFKKKCGDHIRHVLNHAKTKNQKPDFITDENWERLSKYWQIEESKKISEQNKLNQAHNTGALSATYAGGSINMEEHARRLAREIGRDPDFVDTFTRAFQKKDKSWSGDRAKAIKDKFTELSSAASSEGSESSVGNELSMWLEATGGCKGGGRIVGLGSLSRTHRVAAGTSSTISPAVTSQIHSLTEEVTHLKDLLQQRDEEMMRRDHEMRKRDQEMRKRDKQMEKLQRKQDRILQHFQLQLGDDDDDDDDDDDGGDDGGDPS